MRQPEMRVVLSPDNASRVISKCNEVRQVPGVHCVSAKSAEGLGTPPTREQTQLELLRTTCLTSSPTSYVDLLPALPHYVIGTHLLIELAPRGDVWRYSLPFSKAMSIPTGYPIFGTYSSGTTVTTVSNEGPMMHQGKYSDNIANNIQHRK